MAKKITALSVVIGGAVSKGFKSAFKSSTAQISQLGKALGGMETSAGKMQKFKSLKRNVETTEMAWKSAQLEVRRLAKQMAASAKPTKKLSQEFARAKQAASKAKRSFETNRESLQRLRVQLKAAGISTHNLAQQEKKLGSSIDKLQNKYKALAVVRKKSEANKAKRGELRGQLFDAVALGAVMIAPLKAAIGFESAMADVRKVVNFKEPDGLKKMGLTIKLMTREIPLAASELAQITAAGGQLGIKAIDLPKFTETVAKMATAYDMLPDEAGDAMAKLANIYKLPISGLSSLGDAINHLSDNTAAKAPQIVNVLKRVGGNARQFGLTAVQAGALGGAFIALGKPAEKASTAINAMLMKMQTATKQGGKFKSALEEMGTSADELETSIADNAQGALTGFLKTLSKIEKSERVKILSDLFGLEYSDDISLLVGSLGEYEKSLGLVADKQKYAGSMTREFNIRAKTTGNQLVLFKSSVNELGINIGTVLLPPLRAITSVLRGGTTIVADLTTKFPVLTTMVSGLAISLIGAKIAAIGLGYSWTFVKGGWLVMSKLATITRLATAAQWLLNIAMDANPIGAIILGITALISLVYLFRKAIGRGWSRLWGGESPDWSVSRKPRRPGQVLAATRRGRQVSKATQFTGTSDRRPGALPGDVALPAIATRNASITSTNTTNVGGITINAAPGMDETELAEKVAEKINQQALADRRASLYDLPDAYSY